MMDKVEIKNIEPEYIHSSNAIFHFMKEADYLEKAILNKGLCPRYCEEKVGYLGLRDVSQEAINIILVLQKCFCDIPLHCVGKRFPLKVIDDTSGLDEEIVKQLNAGSTHTDFYGEYGIAFSKTWAKKKNIQPVHYISEESTYRDQFKKNFEFILSRDDIDNLVVSDVISRLAYYKPLYGEMTRTINNKKIRILKNFCDECEWRYVPPEESLEKCHITSVIFDDELLKLSNQTSNRLSSDEYREDLWLNYEYQDIRYLIVPDNAARKKLIDYIVNLNINSDDEKQEKYLLISKILVMENIRKDF